ncbi:hypothetical protein STEG23_005693 [Scotinomys teguina]
MPPSSSDYDELFEDYEHPSLVSEPCYDPRLHPKLPVGFMMNAAGISERGRDPHVGGARGMNPYFRSYGSLFVKDSLDYENRNNYGVNGL